MNKKVMHFNRYFLLVFLVLSFYQYSRAQNTVVTDSSTYNADASAVLDVQSVHKGFLAPRMTTSQRNGISSPADGLLVYDVTENAFYVYSPSGWEPLSSETLWMINNDSVYVTGNGVRVGVGTKSPMGRFIIQGDATAVDEPLFEVKNSDGYSIFAVYEDSVAINFIEGTKGVKGGFAVGGLTPGKAEPVEYLKITPHNVRVSIDTSTVKGVKGGFAVGGLTPGKSDTINYFHITPDSARVYLREQSKGVKGGFAVGGLTPGKGITDHYLTIERDSARIYVENSGKGVKGGFAVGGLTPGKAATSNFLSLNPDNYFIGHEAGKNITSGFYNSFIGYQSGFSDTTGSYNSFLGYKAGYSNASGQSNVFIGHEAGYSNTTGNLNSFLGYMAGYSNTGGISNVFIGHRAGCSNLSGNDNVFVGDYAGKSNLEGYSNVFLGRYAGFENTTGQRNVFVGPNTGTENTTGSYNSFLGYHTGYCNKTGENNVYIGANAGYSDSLGSGNIFIGYNAGANETGSDKLYIDNCNRDSSSALIFGDLFLRYVRMPRLGIGRLPSMYSLEVAGDASKAFAGSWLANADKRTKTDITDIEDACAIILKLHPVKFRFSDQWLKKNPVIKDKVYYNFIAQEYKTVFPESVYKSGEKLEGDGEELLDIDTYNAQIVTIKAVQELIYKNAELTNKLEKQDKLIQELIQRIEYMENSK